MNLQNALNQLEARLQTLVEDPLARLFGAHLHTGLAHRLVSALDASLQSGPDGRLLAPHSFNLVVSPSQSQLFLANPAILDELAVFIYQYGIETGLHFTASPTIQITADPSLSPQELQIFADFGSTAPSETVAIPSTPPERTSIPASSAYLIVNGTGIFPLDGYGTNLGRASDNHLVIDDPRVSRNHAQLRAVQGRYVIFDLDSTGGTFVNGQQITQRTLNAGDVLSLAGFPLVFGEEPSPASGETQEIPLSSGPEGTK